MAETECLDGSDLVAVTFSPHTIVLRDKRRDGWGGDMTWAECIWRAPLARRGQRAACRHPKVLARDNHVTRETCECCSRRVVSNHTSSLERVAECGPTEPSSVTRWAVGVTTAPRENSTLERTLLRKRANYREWAAYGETRCSNIVPWYTRTSMKKLSAAGGGTVSSATATTVTDNTESWTNNEWTPGAIEIDKSTGEVRNVSGNTATTITVAQAWNTIPQQDAEFIMLKKSAWDEDTTYATDNENGDGTTSVKIDLS